MNILTIIGTIFIGVLLIVTIAALCMIIQWLVAFHLKKCKHCGHYMEYKGLKEAEKESHYLFHCPKCGAWEQVSVLENP